MQVRPATADDAAAVAAIYNHGIAERQATFETRPRSPREIAAWLDEGRPFLVAVDAGEIVGFARLPAYSARKAHAGIGEHAIYVHARARGRRVRSRLLE